MRTPRRVIATIFTLSLLVMFAVPAARAGDDWPQFRGPTGQGIADAADLPLTWGEGKNVKWKTEIHGKAWSSPVILGNQIWMTTATADGRELFVVCVDRESGKIVRDDKIFDVPNPQYCIPFNSYASPTPAIEPGRLYATFGSPGTACLDTTTGKVLWERRDLQCNHYRGAGQSPLLYKNLLVMQFDGSDYQYILALDKQTGKTIWKTDRSLDYQDAGPDGKPQANGDWRKGFSTPRIATTADGTPVLVSLGSKAAYGYEPETGKEVWRIEDRLAHSGSVTPLIGPDTVYLCMGLGKSELWALRPDGHGLLGDAQVMWKLKHNVPGRPSPVLLDNLIYMTDDHGLASCLDAASGQEVWRKHIKGEFSASVLAAGGRIYYFDQDGKTTVVAAGREFKLLAENQLDDGFMASPAVAGSALFLRTRTHLYRIENAKAP